VSDPCAEPTEIRHKRSARCVLVTWGDGHLSAFPLDYLRSWCPCAICQGHAAEARYLDVHDQELVHLDAVGNYALSFTWQDGHNTGIYPYRLLRRLCPCKACDGPKR
jgi:DUF971 family protein